MLISELPKPKLVLPLERLSPTWKLTKSDNKKAAISSGTVGEVGIIPSKITPHFIAIIAPKETGINYGTATKSAVKIREGDSL